MLLPPPQKTAQGNELAWSYISSCI